MWQNHDSLFSNNIACADLIFRKYFKASDSIKDNGNKFESKFNAQYIFNGANTGNYKLNNLAEYTIKKKTRLFLNVMVERRSADYIYNNWVTNNFGWFNNGYKSQQTQQGEVGISYNKKAGVSLLFQNINNYLFFDDVALPQQYVGSIQNLGVTVFYSTILFKHLGLSVHNVFQTTSHSSYISIPQNISTVKIYYAGNLFKNNLQINIGAQAQAYQSFFANSYMPASQIFYLQNKRVTGDYPYLDVYLNARIRPVTVFVKVENVLFGFVGTNYSLVPGYYQPDRAFRFGLSWAFFD